MITTPLVKRNLLHPFALCIRSIFLGLKDIIDRSQHDVLRAAFQAPAPPSSTADRLLVGKTDNVRIHFLLFLSDRCKKAACVIKQLSDSASFQTLWVKRKPLDLRKNRVAMLWNLLFIFDFSQICLHVPILYILHNLFFSAIEHIFSCNRPIPMFRLLAFLFVD